MGATQGSEALFIQTFRLDDGPRNNDPVRDLRALLNLRHTNVGRLKEILEKDREVTVVSHYTEGETLGALRAAGPIPLGVQLRILVDVLAGLAAIHGVKDSKLKPLGIVHGEIAPANIVVGTDGVPKVIQLCGVHAAPGAHGADTLGYLAPEILLADDAFDQRVDIYAVGVLLWEALSGTQLFPETNPGAIVTRHLSGRIRKATVPADAAWAEPLVDVAQKAIATDPNGRYATVNELANEIKRIAKTNLASTMKVSVLVKERGTEAIAARRAVLGLPALPAGAKPIARPAPKPLEPTPTTTQIALKPVPAPAERAPTTEPVETSALVAESFPEEHPPRENLSESAVKPAVRFPPPEPSVHERVTLPTPIPTGHDEEEITDFSDLATESEPPPPPAPPGPPPPQQFVAPAITPSTQMHLAPPIVSAESAPAPIIAPPPDYTASAPPFATAPLAPPASSDEADAFEVSDEQARKKRRGIVLIAIAAAALILAIGSIRACMKSGQPDTVAKPAETAKPKETAKPEPTPTVAATTEPTETAKPVDTAPTPTPTATATATVTATAPAAPTETSKPPVVAENPPTPPPTAKATSTGGTPPTSPTTKPTSTSKVKPKTYDPLGI